MIPDEALATQRRMVEKLRDPARYPHPVTSVSIIETHISFVLLTGAFAYKIKKAVDLGFVDYACLALLRFFNVYRALVRVKVAHLRATEAELPTDARRTVFAGAVGETLAAACLRSDVERKRQHGLLPLARTGSEIGRALYADDVTAATYAHLAELASSALAAGYPVVIDAACLRRGQRECFQGLARELRVPFVILHCRAPMPILRRRVIARAESGSDASEATLAVLERQCRDAEPLTADEQAAAVTVDTAADSLDQALAEVQQHLKRDWTHETA